MAKHLVSMPGFRLCCVSAFFLPTPLSSADTTPFHQQVLVCGPTKGPFASRWRTLTELTSRLQRDVTAQAWLVGAASVQACAEQLSDTRALASIPSFSHTTSSPNTCQTAKPQKLRPPYRLASACWHPTGNLSLVQASCRNAFCSCAGLHSQRYDVWSMHSLYRQSQAHPSRPLIPGAAGGPDAGRQRRQRIGAAAAAGRRARARPPAQGRLGCGCESCRNQLCHQVRHSWY